MSDHGISEQGRARAGELAKAYDPSVIEEKWASFWVKERIFEVGEGAQGKVGLKAFTMLLPPPNVTGFLHMGHMFEHAESDILMRWHRMCGETALWVPGTDHAGIATQMLVERRLKLEGTDREAMGRDAFIDRVWKWKGEYGGGITEQMRRLGASVDWSREYFTLDERRSTAVNEAFVRLWEQGLIYRGAYIVNWDPVIQTAVSDLEVVHEERVGKIFHVRYPLADGSGSIVVATTRPETMLGDVAVAVNPSDERYRAMVGKMVQLPLSSVNGGAEREVLIVADEWANPEFGTGAVKVTPAHDPNDFAIGQRHGLPSLSILDTSARVALPGSKYDGMDRYAAREAIVSDLQELGLLVEVRDHAMSVGLSQRSGSVIEPRLSDQWFIRIQPLADKAIAAVRERHITIKPEMYEKTFFEWMGNIHDWCISRQLWWGHRIPAWFCVDCCEITVARSAPSVCSKCGSGALRQETDVLDTWFSSGLLPFTVFGWPNAEGSPTADMAAFYPIDVLVTGFDILFFWVARMIMLGTHFMLDVPMPDGSRRELKEAVPFREVYIHALVRDADRQKMSKTKGNVIDPIDMIGRFGTDAVRFTLASMASPGTDIAFSEERTDGYRAFANKIWNAARFLFMNLDRGQEAGIRVDFAKLTAALQAKGDAVPLESCWILMRLSAACGEVEKGLAAYRFDEAAGAVYGFFWGELCDWYLEMVKLRLVFDDGSEKVSTEAALTTLVAVFEAALRLLSPFMPFLTEEIWHALWAHAGPGEAPAKSIALTRFPLQSDVAADAHAAGAMEQLQAMIVAVRGLRKEMGIPEKQACPVRVFSRDGESAAQIAVEHAGILAKMARARSVEIAEEALSGTGSRSSADFDVQVVYERMVDIPAERERLLKEITKLEKGLLAADRQLGNDAFMAKAPGHIVDGLRKQAAETRMLYEKATVALASLPSEA